VFSISECTAALLHFRHYHGLKKGGKKMSSNFTSHCTNLNISCL